MSWRLRLAQVHDSDGAEGDVPRLRSGLWVPEALPALNAHVIEDEGTPLTQRDNLNFVGAGVTVTDDGVDTTTVTISGTGASYPKAAAANATATNPATTSTSYTAVDTACDVTIAAAAGDKLYVNPVGRWNQSTSVCWMDAVSVVGGTVTNYMSGNGSTGAGVSAWLSPGSNQRAPIGVPLEYVVVSGDVSGGNVVVRLMFRANTSGQNNSVARDATNKFTLQVVNLGPG